MIIHNQGQQPFVVGQPQGNIITEMIRISNQILQNLFFAIMTCTITPLVSFCSFILIFCHCDIFHVCAFGDQLLVKFKNVSGMKRLSSKLNF